MNLSNKILIPSDFSDQTKNAKSVYPIRRKSLRVSREKVVPNCRSFTEDDSIKMRAKERVVPDFSGEGVVYPWRVAKTLAAAEFVYESEESSLVLGSVDDSSEASSCDCERVDSQSYYSGYDSFDESFSSEGYSYEDDQPEVARVREESLVNRFTLGLNEMYSKIVVSVTIQPLNKKAPYYEPVVGEMIGEYEVLDVLGKGSFGVVVKAQNLQGEFVAIKIIRKSYPFKNRAAEEVDMLHYLNNYQKDKVGARFIVKVKENFMHDDHFCIVFELLSHTLLDLIRVTIVRNQEPGLSLRMIHKLAYQLIRSLSFLKKAEVIHCDLKPENIALVSPDTAFIKVLDFGSSSYARDIPANKFPYIQSRYYRAPEILMGSTFSYPIDMWSLGCLLFELYTGRPLFQGRNTLTQLYSIMDVIGYIPASIIEEGVFREQFFMIIHDYAFPKQPDQFEWKNKTLWERLNVKSANLEEIYLFYHLIDQMLRYVPDDRITPDEALEHPFIKQNFEVLKVPSNPDHLKTRTVTTPPRLSKTPSKLEF